MSWPESPLWPLFGALKSFIALGLQCFWWTKNRPSLTLGGQKTVFRANFGLGLSSGPNGYLAKKSSLAFWGAHEVNHCLGLPLRAVPKTGHNWGAGAQNRFWEQIWVWGRVLVKMGILAEKVTSSLFLVYFWPFEVPGCLGFALLGETKTGHHLGSDCILSQELVLDIFDHFRSFWTFVVQTSHKLILGHISSPSILISNT